MSSQSLDPMSIASFALVVIVLAAIAYMLLKNRLPKQGPRTEAQEEEKTEAIALQKEEQTRKLPNDLRDVVRILKRNEGRMTQKDLRKEIPLSEAKVSLMLTELEDMGIVKRIKKGRGNVLILKED
jgi:uncharacterized membrane protein